MERVRGDWKVQTDLQRLRKNFPVNYGDLRTSLNILYVVLFAIFLPPHLLVGSKTLLEENLYARRKKLDIADAILIVVLQRLSVQYVMKVK